MAGNYETAYGTNVALYKEVLAKAEQALDALKLASAGGYVDAVPAPFDKTTLEFDPGEPQEIILKLPFELDPIFTQIDFYIGEIKKIQAPQIPTPAEFGVVPMADHRMWDSAFTTSIYTNLSAYISSMGIPDSVYQNAIFNANYDRDLATLSDLYMLADAKTGAKGFSYPNDYGTALKLDAQTKYQFDKAEISRNITKTVTEWARQNYQFAIEKGITIENAQMDFTYRYCTGFMQIYKDYVVSLLESFKAQVSVLTIPVDALIKEITATLDYAKVQADIDKTNISAIQERSKTQITEALQKYHGDIQMQTTQLSTRLQALANMAAHSAGIAQATTTTVIASSKG